MAETLSEKLRRLAKVKKAEDRARREHEALTSERVQLEQECFEMMKGEDGLGSSRKLDGITFAPIQTVYANITDREAFLKWAEENDQAMTEVKEREGELNQLIRTHLDNDEELPPGVSYYVRQKISTRGIKAQIEQEEA